MYKSFGKGLCRILGWLDELCYSITIAFAVKFATEGKSVILAYTYHWFTASSLDLAKFCLLFAF